MIDQALKILSVREQQVMRLRFGLETGVSHNLAEIGRELNVSRERVRQIETEALSKLNDGLKDPKERAGLV